MAKRNGISLQFPWLGLGGSCAKELKWKHDGWGRFHCVTSLSIWTRQSAKKFHLQQMGTDPVSKGVLIGPHLDCCRQRQSLSASTIAEMRCEANSRGFRGVFKTQNGAGPKTNCSLPHWNAVQASYNNHALHGVAWVLLVLHLSIRGKTTASLPVFNSYPSGRQNSNSLRQLSIEDTSMKLLILARLFWQSTMMSICTIWALHNINCPNFRLLSKEKQQN